MSDELLPCPFCGGEAHRTEGLSGDKTPWPYIECFNCAAMAEPDLWNKRANPTPPAAAVSEVTDEMVERCLHASWVAAGFSGPFKWNATDRVRMRAALVAALGVRQ